MFLPRPEPVTIAGGKLTCGDPASTYDLRVPVNGLTFARPGEQDAVEALADGVVFALRELLVIAKEPAGVPRSPSAS